MSAARAVSTRDCRSLCPLPSGVLFRLRFPSRAGLWPFAGFLDLPGIEASSSSHGGVSSFYVLTSGTRPFEEDFWMQRAASRLSAMSAIPVSDCVDLDLTARLSLFMRLVFGR